MKSDLMLNKQLNQFSKPAPSWREKLRSLRKFSAVGKIAASPLRLLANILLVFLAAAMLPYAAA